MYQGHLVKVGFFYWYTPDYSAQQKFQCLLLVFHKVLFSRLQLTKGTSASEGWHPSQRQIGIRKSCSVHWREASGTSGSTIPISKCNFTLNPLFTLKGNVSVCVQGGNRANGRKRNLCWDWQLSNEQNMDKFYKLYSSVHKGSNVLFSKYLLSEKTILIVLTARFLSSVVQLRRCCNSKMMLSATIIICLSGCCWKDRYWVTLVLLGAVHFFPPKN